MAVTAIFKDGENKAYTRTVYQHDKGQKLIIEGIDLPSSYEVHISNDKDHGVSYAAKGYRNEITIPDVLLSTGDYVYAWLYLSDESGEGQTLYEITIPVERKPAPLPIDSGYGGLFGDDYEVDGENLIFR